MARAGDNFYTFTTQFLHIAPPKPRRAHAPMDACGHGPPTAPARAAGAVRAALVSDPYTALRQPTTLACRGGGSMRRLCATILTRGMTRGPRVRMRRRATETFQFSRTCGAQLLHFYVVHFLGVILLSRCSSSRCARSRQREREVGMAALSGRTSHRVPFALMRSSANPRPTSYGRRDAALLCSAGAFLGRGAAAMRRLRGALGSSACASYCGHALYGCVWNCFDLLSSHRQLCACKSHRCVQTLRWTTMRSRAWCKLPFQAIRVR